MTGEAQWGGNCWPGKDDCSSDAKIAATIADTLMGPEFNYRFHDQPGIRPTALRMAKQLIKTTGQFITRTWAVPPPLAQLRYETSLCEFNQSVDSFNLWVHFTPMPPPFVNRACQHPNSRNFQI